MKWNGFLFSILPDQICRRRMPFTIRYKQNAYKMTNEGTERNETIRMRKVHLKVRNCKGATSVYPCSLHIWISKASKCSDTPQNTHFLWTAWLTSHPCSLATSLLKYKLLFLFSLFASFPFHHPLILRTIFPLFSSLFPFLFIFLISPNISTSLFPSAHSLFLHSRTSAQHIRPGNDPRS